MGVKQVVRSVVPVQAWNWLRVMRIRSINLASPKRHERHTYGGFPFTVEIGDPIARGWYDQGWAETPEVAFLRQYGLQPGATVFDLGAHQCVVAMVFSKIVEPGLVVALEGNGYNAAVGKRNVEANGIKNLRVIHGAAGGTSGTITFSETWNGEVNSGSPAVGSVEVRSYTVDELSRLYGPPKVLFIDVEGYEREVLNGASNTLSLFPDCFIEVHIGKLEKYGTNAETILTYFPREHYNLFVRIEEEEETFREFHPGDALPNVRFFLIAIAKVRMDQVRTDQ